MENEIEINGKVYVLKSKIKETSLAPKTLEMEYAIVRTYSAGVFAGYISSENGKEVEMVNARMIWYWDGAASIMQLAKDGTSKPEKCKFPAPVDKVRLKEAIQIIPCTAKAKDSIEGVPVWKA